MGRLTLALLALLVLFALPAHAERIFANYATVSWAPPANTAATHYAVYTERGAISDYAIVGPSNTTQVTWPLGEQRSVRVRAYPVEDFGWGSYSDPSEAVSIYEDFTVNGCAGVAAYSKLVNSPGFTVVRFGQFTRVFGRCLSGSEYK